LDFNTTENRRAEDKIRGNDVRDYALSVLNSVAFWGLLRLQHQFMVGEAITGVQAIGTSAAARVSDHRTIISTPAQSATKPNRHLIKVTCFVAGAIKDYTCT